MGQFVGLINAFSENGNDAQSGRIIEDLMNVLEELQRMAFNKGKDDIQLAKINSCAIKLWNMCVAMRSGKRKNNNINAKGKQSESHSRMQCDVFIWFLL